LENIPKGVGRAAATIGGFLIFMGMIMLGIFALALFKIIDPNFLVKEEIQITLMLAFLLVGILDLLSGIILLTR